MVSSDNIIGKKQYAFIWKILTPSEKPVNAVVVYSLFQIPGNENPFEQFNKNSM